MTKVGEEQGAVTTVTFEDEDHGKTLLTLQRALSDRRKRSMSPSSAWKTPCPSSSSQLDDLLVTLKG
jgi:hypothetical protein